MLPSFSTAPAGEEKPPVTAFGGDSPLFKGAWTGPTPARPSVGAGPRPARGPVPFVGAAFGRPGVWGPRRHGGHRGRSPLYINWGAGGFGKLADGFRKKLCFSAPSTKCLPKRVREALGRKGLREWEYPGEAKCLPKVYHGNFCRSNERLFCCFERFPQPFPACHRCCTALSSCFWECIPPFARKMGVIA